MNPNTRRQVAASLDATPDLLPCLPDLLAGLDNLGGDPSQVVELLQSLGLGEHSQAVDLGCGKGSIAIALAAAFGMRVVGVDAMAAFVAEAERRAQNEGVAHLCSFRCGDLRALEADRPFDVALLVAVGWPFGTTADTMAAVRQRVCSGGWIVIDDAVLAPGIPQGPPGYEDYRDAQATRAELTACGDRVVREIASSPSETRALGRPLIDRIEANAARLARERPEWAERVLKYVTTQECEQQILEQQLVPTMWLLERE